VRDALGPTWVAFPFVHDGELLIHDGEDGMELEVVEYRFQGSHHRGVVAAAGVAPNRGPAEHRHTQGDHLVRAGRPISRVAVELGVSEAARDKASGGSPAASGTGRRSARPMPPHW